MWGTLQSSELGDSNMRQTYQNSIDSHSMGKDCWCQLSAANNQRIVLSIISFEFGNDLKCQNSGLYLQSSRNRSEECTQLQKGHYYISSSQVLFVNFFTKPNLLNHTGSFWIVYEGNFINYF